MPVPTASVDLQAYLLHCYTLPVHITSLDALRWSSDCQLAVATKKGTYVFEVVPDAKKSCQKINFVKTFLENDTEVNPWQMTNAVPQEVLQNVSSELRTSVNMDRVMTPHMAGGESSFRQPSRVDWTPYNSRSEKCFLVTLTVDFRLRFFKLEGKQWNCEVDVSEILLNYLKEKPLEEVHKQSSNLSEDEAIVKNLKSRCYSLATNCWCWKGNEQFITGQLSGHVVFWEWGRSLIVRNMYKTDLEEISCVHFEQLDSIGVLFVAGQDGRVLALKTGRNLTLLGWVWNDLDRLPVHKITTRKIEGKYLIVMAKSSFCITMNIKVNKSKIDVGSPSHINTGLTKIVCMEHFQDKVLICNQKSSLKLWDMKNRYSNINLSVTRDHYYCYGVAGSPNQSIFCCLENISSFNDHLIMREPGRLVFWTMESQESLKTKLVTQDFVPDAMEAFKLIASANKVDLEVSELSSDLKRCRADWWHYNVILSRLSSSSTSYTQYRQAINHCEKVLRGGMARTVINAPQGQYNTISKVASAKFLQVFMTDSSKSNAAAEIMFGNNITSWECRICGASADEKSNYVSIVKCLSGHVWPRCVSSQQPVCDTCPVRCCWCKAVAVQTINKLCCLCGGPLLNR